MLGEASDDLSGGAGDANDGMDYVSTLDDGKVDKTGGDISDSDREADEDTGSEQNHRL